MPVPVRAEGAIPTDAYSVFWRNTEKTPAALRASTKPRTDGSREPARTTTWTQSAPGDKNIIDSLDQSKFLSHSDAFFP